jgi:hypothetical protein
MESNDQRAPIRPRTEEVETEFEYLEVRDNRSKKKLADLAKDWPAAMFQFQYKDDKPTGKALCKEKTCNQGGGCHCALFRGCFMLFVNYVFINMLKQGVELIIITVCVD